jgi:hypothetical protein
LSHHLLRLIDQLFVSLFLTFPILHWPQEYVYLLQERELVTRNENVYKIGRTTQINLSCLTSIPRAVNPISKATAEIAKSPKPELSHYFLKDTRDKWVQGVNISREMCVAWYRYLCHRTKLLGLGEERQENENTAQQEKMEKTTRKITNAKDREDGNG